MSSLAKELLVDPWRRLKWGFIPVRREVTDLDAGEAKELVPSEVEKEEGTSLELSGDRTSSADGELTKEEFRETKKNLDTASTDISEYEYKDEANRKWYKFFDEQEYRIKKSQASNNKWYSWFNAGTSTKEKKIVVEA
ncbi:CAS_1a_G0052840.mRNA.1.CDS.1 [Saccharomyces cerevisiae]|nr:CAS_1a_G0052840.mRNA.1.CDS.1 [Saccharomyces cerevisiae]CAI7472510.1 CAS_1a_G0052840.mRNA.1.CDS.1 [Saccharomyces cerevisiae]